MRPAPKLRLKPNLRRRHVMAGLLGLASMASCLVLIVPGPPALAEQQAGSGSSTAARTQHTQPNPAGYHRGVASWYYDDGGPTACGFHASYGVADDTLPCGTHITMERRGHRITVVVDDRGPYVAGRTWDLDERSARTLGVSGVATVWATWPSH